MVRGSNPVRGKICSSRMSRLALGPTQPPTQWVQGVLFRVWSGQGLKLTTHLRLMLRLWMSGAVFLTALHAFNEWTGNTITLPFLTRWYMKMLEGNVGGRGGEKLTKLLLHPHQNAEWPIWREIVCCVSGSTCSYKKNIMLKPSLFTPLAKIVLKYYAHILHIWLQKSIHSSLLTYSHYLEYITHKC